MSLFAPTPWHQRCAPVRWLRGALRGRLFRFLGRLLATDDARGLLAGTLTGLLAGRPALDAAVAALPAPYPGLGAAPPDAAATGAGAVFVTGRFRSGSTLLWNLFRNLDGFTAYYEPLNERRWFDPARRGDRVDPTHRNVDDYWREYEGLDELGRYYREEWIGRNLFMDAGAWDPGLDAYVRLLLARAPGRSVLQFNRVDFRLPWLRRQFPEAKVVHLYRHPRDQWCSSLGDLACFPKDGTVADFPPHDKFYLLLWADDLRHHFPFLDRRAVEHPYELFYFLWKLSYLFGRQYAHHSLAFEDLVNDPRTELQKLFAALDIDPGRHDLQKLQRLIVRPALRRWKQYAEDDWFVHLESRCEATLARFLAPGAPARPETEAESAGARNGRYAP